MDTAAGAWLDAERGFAAAVELDDRNPVVRASFALLLLGPAGLIEPAIREMTRAVADGPAIANTHVTLSQLAVIAGDMEGARSALDMARLLGAPEDRSTIRLVRSELARHDGRADEAGEHAAAVAAQWPGLAEAGAADLARRVFAATVGGADQTTLAVSRFVERTDADGALWRVAGAAGQLMVWQTRLGDIDGAYQIAHRMVAAWRRTGHLPSISLVQLWRPEMKPFRDDSRFDALVADLGLALLWRRLGASPP